MLVFQILLQYLLLQHPDIHHNNLVNAPLTFLYRLFLYNHIQEGFVEPS